VPQAEFLRDLVLGMRCGVLCIDRRGRLMMVNELAAQILALRGIPPVGTPLEELVPEHPQLVRVLRESFSMSSLPTRAEVDLARPSGGSRTVGFTLSLIRGAERDPYGVAMFFKDLTQVEQRQEQDRLKDRLAALGHMAANLAHEMRNPLASIKVCCSLLRRRVGRGDRELCELLDRIGVEAGRLNRTISSSLEFVRPLTPALAPARLNPILEQAIRVALRRTGARGIRVVRRLDPSLPPFLMDRAQLRQVFENLMLNAVEAMGEAGTLTVESCQVPAPAVASIPYEPERGSEDPWQSFEAYAEVRVGDTGPGIREDLRDKLFYPFFTTKPDGSGMGLSIANKIVTSHRGLLDVDSWPEGGAVFLVRLPLIRRAEEARR
jgi:nitrogen-specific signal transduction histidine kinase